MQRLLMGEVGSGKTVVALFALLRAVEHGMQGAFMAPTETLAEQHFATLQSLLGGEPVTAALLTGSTPAGRRADVLGKLASGELSLIVGTHALIEPAVVFDHVSLAFDEQVVLSDLTFSVPKGSMKILLGASGAGKSVVLKLILGLMRPDSGTIHVDGQRVDNMPERDLLRLRADIGMMFQENALFDSLTVDENVGYRLYEETDTPPELLVRIHEPALPEALFRRLLRAVQRVGDERLRHTYQTTFWFDLRTPPSSVVEEAALALRERIPGGDRIAGVEWWLSRMSPNDVRVDFHQDRDERLALAGGPLVHPTTSSVPGGAKSSP